MFPCEQCGESPMNVDCNNCRARYRLDEAMFKGSKGIQVRRRRVFKWSFLIPFVCLILLLFGGSVSLVFTQVGKRVLAGIGQELADAITFFRTRSPTRLAPYKNDAGQK